MAKTSTRHRRTRLRWLERLLFVGGLACLGASFAMVAEGRIYQLLGRWQLQNAAPAEAVAENAGAAGVWLGQEAGTRWDSPLGWMADRLVEESRILPWDAWTDWAADRVPALRQQHHLQSAPAEPAAPAPPPPPGTPLGTIVIPDAGVDAVILEGIDDDVLRRGVGHFPRTPMAGAGGNFALAGHRDTFFRGLRNVEVGQRVVVTTAEGRELVYRVESTEVVKPSRVEVLDDLGRETLTLVTCYPFRYVGFAPERFIVRAHLETSLADDRKGGGAVLGDGAPARGPLS